MYKINLTEREFFAEGKCRKVYLYPGRPDFCIKIDKTDHEKQNQIELDCYRHIVRNKDALLTYVPKVEGFVSTNLGDGLICELILHEDRPAPNIIQAISRGIVSKTDAAFLVRDMMMKFIRYRFSIWDHNLENILFSHGRLFIVDGLISRQLGIKYFLRKHLPWLAVTKSKFVDAKLQEKIERL